MTNYPHGITPAQHRREFELKDESDVPTCSDCGAPEAREWHDWQCAGHSPYCPDCCPFCNPED